MDAITSVLGMARGTTTNRDEAAKRKALEEVKRFSDAVRKGEAATDRDRKARNEAFVKASRYAPATEIARVAGIKQSYVSRVIRSRGKPASGSDLDRSRDKEVVDA